MTDAGRPLQTLCGWALCLALTGCADAPVDSCIVIVADTLRADHLTVYGYGRPTSPELERWSEEGVVYEHTFSTSPWTLPAFGTLLTGQLPSRHRAGMKTGPRRRAPLADDLDTLAEALQSEGVATAAFTTNPYLKGVGSRINRGFDLYENEMSFDENEVLRYRPADRGVTRALEWIEQQRGRFFVMLHLFDAHFPLRPPIDLLQRFSGPNPAVRGMERDTLFALEAGTPAERAAYRDTLIDLYDAEIAFVDREVGRLLSELERSGKLRRTLVIFSADHGEELFERDRYEHGHTLYNELLRVPLLVWHPGAVAGRRSELVSWLDLASTVTEALGVAPLPGTPGLSLLASVRGRPLPDRSLIADGTKEGPSDYSVIAARFKLTVRESGAQLFDWRADPAERSDLWPGDERAVSALLAAAKAGLGTERPALGEELSEDQLKLLRALGYVE